MLGGGRRDAADVEDGGLVSCSSCLGSGDNGCRLAVSGGHQLQDGAGRERTLGLWRDGGTRHADVLEDGILSQEFKATSCFVPALMQIADLYDLCERVSGSLACDS